MEKLRELDTVVDGFFLEDKSILLEKIKMRKNLGMTLGHIKAPRFSVYDSLKLQLYRAGIEREAIDVINKLMHATMIGIIAGMIVFGLWMLSLGLGVVYIITLEIIWVGLGVVSLYPLFLLLFKVYLSHRIFSRKLEVERVLPDFLRLVASNYRSGLPLDKALKKSSRPEFGIFAKEIDLMAKTSSAKGDLAVALEIFGKKFDSKVLQRAMNSISMSIRSGSNVSELLEEIATNITRMRNIRKSMAANVKNYVIFIIVAAIIIAPMMYSMSFTMNVTIASVKGLLVDTGESGAPMGGKFAEGGGVQPESFNTFAYLMLLTNSIVCALVVSVIKNGNMQQGVKYIPVYVVSSIVLYLIGKWLFTSMSLII